MRFTRTLGAVVTAAVLATSCGGESNDGATASGGGASEFAGYQREPAPMVGDFSLPDLTHDGADFALRAAPGELLVVYFGYTNCPDFCPTTLSDLRLATRRIDPADAALVEVAMVTVDPDRDTPILADYITSFFDDGRALGTDDDAALARVAAPFGVSYDVSETAAGEIEVAHTTSLYAINDAGELALTWQFGVSIDDLAADLTTLLHGAGT